MDAGERKKIGILSFTLVVVMLGFGLVIPIFPFFIDQLGAGGRELGLLVATSALLEFLFAPLWGGISDRIGRKPVLMIGLFGSVFFYTLFGVATIYQSLTWLFVTRIGAGIAGATIPTAQAYIADTTPPDKRTRGMALIGVAF